MSHTILKPVLVGLFVLVILIAALVLAYSSSPQASEITSTQPSAVASSTPLYMEVYPGMAQCADGEDNDGDGLMDWSATEDSSTADPDCAAARDRSERFNGLQ